VTSEGLRAIASLPALTHLHLQSFHGVTDEGVATLSSLTALKSLELWACMPRCITRGDYGAAATARAGLAHAVPLS
jgi:hypothetical protein